MGLEARELASLCPQMRLDLPTLVVVSTFVTALCGTLLLFAWTQNRDIRALLWWGVSLVVGAAALLLLIARLLLPNWLSVVVGNMVTIAAFGILWGGFRVFEGRNVPALAVAIGPLVWLGACGVPAFHETFYARVLLGSVILAAYTLAAAAEVWRGRAERLTSRGPIVALLILHAVMLLARYPTVGGLEERSVILSAPWIMAHAVEMLIFTVTMAFLLLGMTKERIEAEQRTIAGRDYLTGIPNRRAFFEAARRLLDRARRDHRSSALLLVDLDHFKDVNDRFGHGAGDDVLVGFTRLAARTLPRDALLARFGGEEFACLLPRTTEAEALAAAEMLRQTLASTWFEAGRERFGVTASIGLASSHEFGHILEALLAAADASLYIAKNGGRNRVETMPLSRDAGSEVGPLAA